MDDQSKRDEGSGRIKPEADPRLSRSMEFGLAILQSFSEESATLGIADLAKLVGIKRSTTHRYATTLVVLGYLEQDSKRKYHLARRAAAVGAAAIGALRVRVGALPILEGLREQTGHTVSLGVLDGDRALYIERLPGYREGQYEVDRNGGIGVSLPLHCTAIGKALLAGLPKRESSRRLSDIELTRHGPNTIVGKRRLDAELERIRQEGLAVSDEEHAAGARSIAALVRDSQIEQLLAIEVGVPARAYTVQQLVKVIGPRLESAAKLISSG
jgi:IclR family pca regulon transcriptional regulator